MNKLQKHLIQLTAEVVEACEKNNLPYVLYGSTAAWAAKHKTFAGEQCEMHLLMPAGDILKLKSVLKAAGRKDREFEDLSTNPKLSFNVLRYVDSSTTLIDTADATRYDCLGSAVTVHPAFPGKLGAVARAMETTLPYFNGAVEYNRFLLTDSREKAYATMKTVEHTLGAKFLAKRLFKHLSGGHSKTYSVVTEPQIVATVAHSVFETAKVVKFEGLELKVPKDMTKYLKSHYGPRYAERKDERPQTANRIACIRYDDVPYAEALEMMAEDGIDYRTLQQELFEQFEHVCNTVSRLASASNADYNIARVSRDRIDTFMELEPKRDQLRQAAAGKDVDALAKLMKPYLDFADEYLREYRLGFFVDDELHGFAKLVWESKGKSGYAEKIYDAVPQAFKKRSLREHLSDYL